MSVRKISFAPGEYFHIYNRGNSKQTIFHNDDDYRRFIKLLFLSNSHNNFKISNVSRDIFNVDRGPQLVSIGAYCLMPNHFHLLLTQNEDGSISKFMQKLSTGYSMYYNIKHERTGTLFEGKFKAEHCDDNSYLKYIFSYIHLNPVKLIDPYWKEMGIRNKNKVAKFLENYQFSSYLDYLERERQQVKILDMRSFPNYFPRSGVFMKEILSWINY